MPTHSPVNAAVAHDDVRGSETGAELGGHGEQPHSGGPAGGVLTGGGAATADKTLHQAVELLQSIEGTHQLGGDRGTEVRAGKSNTVRLSGGGGGGGCMKRIDLQIMRCLRCLHSYCCID